MSIYRSNASFLTPDTLEELVAARANLRADEGLWLSYRFLPWKRHVVALCHRPESLVAHLTGLAARAAVKIRVLRGGSLAPGSYQLASIGGVWRLVRPAPWPGDENGEAAPLLDELLGVEAARVEVDGVRFGLVRGEYRFEVSSYEIGELGALFASAYPLEKLDLPPLLHRPWSTLDRLGAP